MGLCVIFGIKGTTIVGSLGAITAVLVLVFRDTILGFVTGIHVATSKNLKVGDWVSIPKYSIEGNITDISLLTTKITNFDKTVSTIPTYDLLTTEIKNLQVMSESNTRRIKKSIYFNINSFKFLNEEDIERLKEINLISDYLEEKTKEIEREKQNLQHNDKTINGRQLTNIGVFRYYAQKYIENDPDIDQKGAKMVRQLDITPQGLPLEVYCFSNDSKWEHFEQIQADIFDHLLVASKEFDLQVMQISVKV
ncbi:Miniconductance mechanosensitive channel YbdG [Chryseobacterium oranimense G311]|nr:mechanosensitive ion channel domain-containing protein [Chryseobacterium oranimense]CEJ71470.1 Miniconductance mechanosensitive channel YbdG [Chryseobacterium oranimense G311]